MSLESEITKIVRQLLLAEAPESEPDIETSRSRTYPARTDDTDYGELSWIEGDYREQHQIFVWDEDKLAFKVISEPSGQVFWYIGDNEEDMVSGAIEKLRSLGVDEEIIAKIPRVIKWDATEGLTDAQNVRYDPLSKRMIAREIGVGEAPWENVVGGHEDPIWSTLVAAAPEDIRPSIVPGDSAAEDSPPPEAYDPVDPAIREKAQQTLTRLVKKVRDDIQDSFGFDTEYMRKLNRSLDRAGKEMLKPVDANALRTMLRELEINAQQNVGREGNMAQYDPQSGRGTIDYLFLGTGDASDEDIEAVLYRLYDTALMDHLSRMTDTAGPAEIFADQIGELFDLEILDDLTWRPWSYRGNYIYQKSLAEAGLQNLKDDQPGINTTNKKQLELQREQSKEDLKLAKKEFGDEETRVNNIYLYLRRLIRDLGSPGVALQKLCDLEGDVEGIFAPARNVPSRRGRRQHPRVYPTSSNVVYNMPQYQRILMYLIQCRNPKAAEVVDTIASAQSVDDLDIQFT